ncbi:MAG TPA: alginate lyase family protein [Gemmatimonadales bacterium]|jgi:hypothetical protein|nr:alginate lyase family protein [Gemmatimonadales bacterium]
MRLRETLSLFPLAGYRLLQRARLARDEQGGLARFEASERRRWEAGFLAEQSIAVWLARDGAGRFWLPPASGRRWARRSCSPDDQAWAEAVLTGRWSLLGAAESVRNPPAWRRDLYSGAEWPLEPSSRIPLLRGDGSDIRTVWELSRCYHFVVLAKAFWRTGEARFARTFREQVESWLETNPAGRGPNWRSPMDAAIRAANWVVATLLFAGAEELPSEFWSRLLANLRVTARFVERHLEWHPRYRGNHFISNAVGLVYVGALFRDDPAGARWLARGARILRREMEFQVSPDGVSCEAAPGYHRLVTEFFSYGGDLCERNGHPLPASFWSRLRSMYGFIDTYLDAAGLAPLIGDADDGRLHLLCAEAGHRPGAHRLGLPRRYWPLRPPVSAAFPQGGFYVLRSGRSRCIVRCGPVGLHGAGSHDHNDQLSYELVLDGRRLIMDSGTYAYTRSLAERFAFRATAAHNAIQLGDEEQNPIRPERPWRILKDRTRAQCVEWVVDASSGKFRGRHAGYAHRPSGAVCHRSISAHFDLNEWSAADRVEGRGRELLTWRTHFAPGELLPTRSEPGDWSFRHSEVPGYSIRLTASTAMDLTVGESRLSERYGTWVKRPMLVLEGEVELPLELTLTIGPAGNA